MTRQFQAMEDRFWSKVQQGDGCWEFQGARKDGYGMFQMGRGMGTWKAHQVAWELTRGPRDGKWVLHKCDNPPCCRPDHLYLGGPKENGADMSRRGRSRSSKITHCPKGHPYDHENTRYDQGRRRCRICCKVKRHEQYLRTGK